MYIQLVTFVGPRTAAQVAASARAGRERLDPLFAADPEVRAGLLTGYRCVADDGGEVIVSLAESPATFERMRLLIESSELLPGEDPALLPGPSRVDVFEVTDTFGADPTARVPR